MMSDKDEVLKRHLQNKNASEKAEIDQIAKLTGLSKKEVRTLLEQDPNIFDVHQTKLEGVPSKPSSLKDLKVNTEALHEEVVKRGLNGRVPRVTVNHLVQAEMVNASIGSSFHSLGKRLRWGGSIGAGVALLGNILNGENDSLLGTLIEMGVGVGIGTGAHYLLDKFMERSAYGRQLSNWLENQVSELKDVGITYQPESNRVTAKQVSLITDKKTAEEALRQFKESYTTGDMEIEKTIRDKHVVKEIDEEAIYRKGARWARAMKIGTLVGMGIIGVSSLLDISEKLDRKTDAQRMVRKQEKNLERRQIAEKRILDSMGYGHVDMGQIVFDMFNERIGHHKMGNAKFY